MKTALSGTKAQQIAIIAAILLMISLVSAAQTAETPQATTAAQPAYQPKFAGDPARGIAPCSACHGPGGYKLGAPALQQQRAPYIERQLGAFAEGMRQKTSASKCAPSPRS